MRPTEHPMFSFDLAVHHECAHVLANARDNRLFHCMRLRLDPQRGWEGGVKHFDEDAIIGDEDDGDHCKQTPFGAVETISGNPVGVTETVLIHGVRVPKLVAEGLQALTEWDELLPLLFRYAAGQAGERLRAMQLDLGPHVVVDVMATEQTSMDRQAARLLSRRAIGWTEAAFETHWMKALNDASVFLSRPPIWGIFLGLGEELMRKYDDSVEFWANWWGLSQDTRQQLISIGR